MAVAGDAVAGILGSFSGVGLVALGASAVAAGAAFVLLRGNASYADQAIEEMNATNVAAARAANNAAAAIRNQSAALAGLRSADLGERAAKLDVIDAHKAYDEAVRTSGRSSAEAARAQVQLRQAELGVTQARQASLKAALEAVRATEKSSAAVQAEVRAARQAKDAAQQKALALRLGFINGEKAKTVSDQLAQADQRLARASQTAEARHRANAARARELAGAIRGADASSEALRARLNQLSATELNMAGAISVLNAVRGAAEGAASGINHVISLINAARSSAAAGIRVPAVATVKTSKEFTGNQTGVGGGLRSAAVGSALDLQRTEAAGERAARQASLGAQAGAAGKSAAEIQAAGDRAYKTSRLSTIATLKSKIKTRYAAVTKSIAGKRRQRAAIKVPRKGQARQNALDRRRRLTDQINALLDEMETLAANDADLTVEAAELGADIAALDRGDSGDEGPSAGDYYDAAVAEASLTPGLDDDLAAAVAREQFYAGQVAAARASGDPRLLTAAINDYNSAQQARQAIEAQMANTDALNANTDALRQSFTGSNTFSYQGQSFTLRSLAPPSSDRLVGAEATI